MGTTTTTTSKPEPVRPEGQPVEAEGEPEAEHSSASSKFVCGIGPKKMLSFDDYVSRIIGGQNAIRSSWPFIVALLNRGHQFCGGSLLDSTHILTAAHCVAHMDSWDVARLEVALGMHTLKPIDPSALRKKVRRVTRHKGFDSRTLYNDIALLTLDSPVTFPGAMSPVCLPNSASSDKYAEQEAAVIGWGAIKEGGSQPAVLQQVTVKIQTNEKCKKNYGNDAPGGIVDHFLSPPIPARIPAAVTAVVLLSCKRVPVPSGSRPVSSAGVLGADNRPTRVSTLASLPSCNGSTEMLFKRRQKMTLYYY